MDGFFSSGRWRFSHKTRRKISVFAICMVISLVLWLFFYLSNEYHYQVASKVIFVNQPSGRAVAIKDSLPVTLTVSSTGWNYFIRRLRPGVLRTDLSSLEDEESIDLRKYLGSYNRQTGSSQQIVDINPDTVYFDMVARMEKKVPVILDADISYLRQYINYGPVTLNPDSVVISGPVVEVKPIEELHTVHVKMDNVSSTVRRLIPLDRKNKKNIYLGAQSVMLNIPVEEFTENTLKVPVTILNNSANYDVTLVPAAVSITYYVPLSRYAEVGPEDFRVTVDLDEWQEKGKNALKVQLERFPDFVKVMRTHPGSLDFLVYK